MESNRKYHYVFKYGLLGLAVFFTLFAIVHEIAPESITVNGRPGTKDITVTMILVLIAVLAFLVFLLIKDKFAMVELRNETITINHNGEVRTISWLDVEEVSLIRFAYPPLYKLKVKGDEAAIWFNTELSDAGNIGNTRSTGDYVIDLSRLSDSSDMGRLIKRKKAEYRI